MATVAKHKVASVKDVKSAVHDLAEEHLRCRDIGHVWHQYRVKRVRGGFERSMFCRSCKTNKHQFLSTRGEILASNYTYNEGYQFRGLGRVQADGKSVLRLESLNRIMAKGGIEIAPEDLEENED